VMQLVMDGALNLEFGNAPLARHQHEDVHVLPTLDAVNGRTSCRDRSASNAPLTFQAGHTAHASPHTHRCHRWWRR
jgi:hypothetical protein